MNIVEVFRAKNKLYNELLQHETGNDITQSIGNQLLYLNRVVPRSEIATRISNIEQPHLSRVARNWFFDRVKIKFLKRNNSIFLGYLRRRLGTYTFSYGSQSLQ